MATTGNSSNEFFTPENQRIPTSAARWLNKVANTGSDTTDYLLLFLETISENVTYVNKDHDFRTVAQALNYLFSLDLDKTIDEQIIDFTVPNSLIEVFEGDDLSTMIGKFAKGIIELKTLLNFISKSDISAIGDGTITGAISFLNEQFTGSFGAVEEALDIANREVI